MTEKLFEEYRKETGKGVYDSCWQDEVDWLTKKLLEANKKADDIEKKRDAISGRCFTYSKQLDRIYEGAEYNDSIVIRKLRDMYNETVFNKFKKPIK